MEAEEDGSQTAQKSRREEDVGSEPYAVFEDAAAEEQGRRTMRDDPAEKSAKFDEDAAAIAPDAT